MINELKIQDLSNFLNIFQMPTVNDIVTMFDRLHHIGMINPDQQDAMMISMLNITRIIIEGRIEISDRAEHTDKFFFDYIFYLHHRALSNPLCLPD